MKEKNKRNEFGRAARISKKVNTKIEELEKNRKKPFTPEEKRRRIKWETKKELRKSNIRAFIVAIVGTNMLTGIGTTAALNEGNKEIKKSENEISIDVEKAEKDIKIKNLPDDRKVFIEGIKVDIENINQEQELRNNAKTDVEIMEKESEDFVKEYLKNIYAEEYNKQNKDNINAEQIRINSSIQRKKIYKDIDSNGEIIYKEDEIGDKNKNYINTEEGVMTITIKKDDGIFEEKAIKVDNKFYTVYNDNKNIEEYKKNVLEKVGNVIDKGVDWNVARYEEENDYDKKEEYKEKFIEAIKEYKEMQIEEDKQPRIKEDEQTLE